MQMSYCDNCEKTTGHKRALGAGTVIGALVTGGLSLAATPFYPLRCVVCGTPGRETRDPTDPELCWPLPLKVLAAVCVLHALVLIYNELCLWLH